MASETIVLFPPPVEPTSAIVCPRCAASEKPSSTGTPSRYQKSTASNRISWMCAWRAGGAAAGLSAIAGSVASSVAMRSAALDALRMSAKRCASSCTGCANSAAYCMNAMSVPSVMPCAESTSLAPRHRMIAPAPAASVAMSGT